MTKQENGIKWLVIIPCKTLIQEENINITLGTLI